MLSKKTNANAPIQSMGLALAIILGSAEAADLIGDSGGTVVREGGATRVADRVDRRDALGDLAYGSGVPALILRLVTLFLEGGGWPS